MSTGHNRSGQVSSLIFRREERRNRRVIIARKHLGDAREEPELYYPSEPASDVECRGG